MYNDCSRPYPTGDKAEPDLTTLGGFITMRARARLRMVRKIEEFLRRLEAAKPALPELSDDAKRRIEEQRRISDAILEVARAKYDRPRSPTPDGNPWDQQREILKAAELIRAEEIRAAVGMLRAMELEFRPLVGEHYPATLRIIGRTAAEWIGPAAAELGAREAIALEVVRLEAEHWKAIAIGASETERRAKIRTEWLERAMATSSGVTISSIEQQGGPSYKALHKWIAGENTRKTNSLRASLAVFFSCDLREVPL